MEPNAEHEWKAYRTRTLEALSPILAKAGFSLDELQPHLLGERFLTRPLGSARKLVLIGKRLHDDMQVVIKVSDDREGTQELLHEHECRRVLNRLPFAYAAFPAPTELDFIKEDPYTLLVSEYLTQNTTFLARPLEEQFALVLSAFKAQEGAHATTYGHLKMVHDTFGEMTGEEYAQGAKRYATEIHSLVPSEARTRIEKGAALVRDRVRVLTQYGSFLTHWDFTPQNFRIHDRTLYFLDLSSLRFGNKYEGWARLINFMVLYNPPLAEALIEYVRANRTPEELQALYAMRIYRLLELIRYYTTWLARAEGDLLELTHARITFWLTILEHVMDESDIPETLIKEYRATRDRLRSADEKKRQEDLH